MPTPNNPGVPSVPQPTAITTFYQSSGTLTNGQRFSDANVMEITWPYDGVARTFKIYALTLVQKNGVYTFDNPALVLTLSSSDVFNTSAEPPFNFAVIPGGITQIGSMARPSQIGLDLNYGLHFFAMQACNSQGCSGLSPVFFVRTANNTAPELTAPEREANTLAGYFITDNTPALLYKTTFIG